MADPNGPPVPFPPDGGHNAIGQFEIGVSQIGDYPLLDFWNTIISQYANSPVITQLVANVFQYIDQTANVIAFFDNVMNIDTATGYGLDLWGRILGVTRVLTIPSTSFFGFEEAGAGGIAGWNQAPFFSGTLANNNFSLSDASFRTLLYAKALANITNGSIPALNAILLTLFPGRGNCFVTDLGNMQMTYTFNFVLSPVEQAIVTASGVLPKPVGVSLTIVQNG